MWKETERARAKAARIWQRPPGRLVSHTGPGPRAAGQLQAWAVRPGHQAAAGPEPFGSADRDGAAGGALQLAGKGECLLGRDQPHLLDGLASAAKELDRTGGRDELLDARLIAVNPKPADFANGALYLKHILPPQRHRAT